MSTFICNRVHCRHRAHWRVPKLPREEPAISQRGSNWGRMPINYWSLYESWWPWFLMVRSSDGGLHRFVIVQAPLTPSSPRTLRPPRLHVSDSKESFWVSASYLWRIRRWDLGSGLFMTTLHFFWSIYSPTWFMQSIRNLAACSDTLEYYAQYSVGVWGIWQTRQPLTHRYLAPKKKKKKKRWNFPARHAWMWPCYFKFSVLRSAMRPALTELRLICTASR